MREDYAAIYTELHKNHKHYTGKSIRSGLPHIVKLVEETKPRRLLDYGCGKGQQYSVHKVHEAWGGLKPHCFDVGVPAFSENPTGYFDGVICTDVMEHIDPADVDTILDDIFGFLRPRDDGGTSFAFFWISCRPAARKTLPDGRNVHLCVREPSWWDKRLALHARARLIVDARYETGDE